MRSTIIAGLAEAYQSFMRMLAEFLPRLAVMLIIILLGLLVAFLFKQILKFILRLTNLDRLSEQSGASQVLRNAALPPMTEFLSRSIFWVTWLGFWLVALSVLGIPPLQEQISNLFHLLPQIFVAIVILFFGLLAANFFSRAVLLATVNAGYRSPKLWSGVTRFVIWILAISMALEQIGLATQTVITAFSIVFGALMLALAIAFGIGGRDLARQTLEKYVGEKRREREKEEEPSPL
jgi:small-conductance mechanosensitive channel